MVLQSCCKAPDAACIAFLEPEQPLLETGQSTKWPNTSSLHLQCYKPSLWSHRRSGSSSSRLRQNTNYLKSTLKFATQKKNYKRKRSQNYELIAVLLLLQESILVTIIHVPECKPEYFKCHRKSKSCSLTAIPWL